MIDVDLSERIRLQSTRFNLFYEGVDGAYLINCAVPQYLKWVKQSEYLLFGQYSAVEGYTRFWASLASKRGNKKYGQRLDEKFKELQGLPDTKFFNYKDRGSRHKTRGLYGTLTYAHKGLTVGEAWQQVGIDYNRFITAFRKKYGKTSVLRVWESQQNGYPHIHFLAICENQEFNTFHYNNKWRVDEKDTIANMWKGGFSDIEALSSTKGGMTYISKYLGKLHTIGSQVPDEEYTTNEDSLSNLVSKASVLTLSMMWLFRKRAFSLSGSLVESIRELHNSNLISEDRALELVQLVLDGDPVPDYPSRVLLLGFWAGRLMKGSIHPRWSVDLSASEVRKLKNSGSWIENRYLEANR